MSTDLEKARMDIKDIASKVKAQLKKEFPKCTFSVRIKRYSGGQSMDLSLMKADVRVKRKFEEITDEAFWFYEQKHYDKEQIKNMHNDYYNQLNHYLDDYDPNRWCNGVFLTEKGHNILKRAVEITKQYNYDNSDSQIDYFDVNFYLHLELGRYDKPFEDGDSA